MASEIIDVINLFDAAVEAEADIHSFIFDDISALNGFKATDYPVLILKPMDILIPSIKKKDDDYQVDLFVYDTYKQGEQKDISLAQKWSNLQLPLYRIIDAVADPVAGNNITNQITLTVGHRMHNDDLIGIRARFTLRVVACRV